MRSLVAELKRRNVLRAGALYVAAAWALAQGVAQLGPVVGTPDWVPRWFLVAAAIGLPFFLAFAWFYEFTPTGLKRESQVDPAESITRHTGKKLDRWIIAVMAVAIVLLLTDRFVLAPGGAAGPGTPAASLPEKSIAVLPFVNMSSDKEQEYFTDGISEELLNLLAKTPELRVIGRTSSFQFKGKNEDLRVIAQKLGVAHLLEGSVRKSGDKIRLTAQLIRAGDGAHLWSETYDRELDDIFAVQDEVAGEVVKALKITLLGGASTTHTTTPEAYALYLQARQLGRQSTAEAFAQSDALYQKVLAVDPTFAPAWDGLSTNYVNEAGLALRSYDEGLRLSREAAQKALAIDSDYAPAYSSLGWLAMLQGDLAGAARYFERALAIDPSDLDILRAAAVLLRNLGRVDEGIAIDEYVVARDPVDATALHALGAAYISAGRFEDGVSRIRTALNLAPGRGGAHYRICLALLLQDRPELALAELQQETSEAWRMIAMPMVYHALGRTAESDAALAVLETTYAKDSAFNIAYVHAFRGEADHAFEWLDKAVGYDDPGISEIVFSKDLFADLPSDPRWLPFLRKVGKAPEQLQAIKFNVQLPVATVAH